MSSITDRRVAAELRRLAQLNGGLLSPFVVVSAARKKTSPLHKYFTWEDGAAAEKWRLHEARNLIRVTVEYLPNGDQELKEVRVMYSLPSDRTSEGGYRVTTDVLSDEDRYAELLEMAKAEMQTFAKKYRHIKELAGVIAAIEAVA
jgi:hypothetical protein